MILEQAVQPYSVWFPTALRHFGESAFFVILAAAVISFFIAAFRYGPLPAGDLLYRTVVGSVIDLVQISPRRISALTPWRFSSNAPDACGWRSWPLASF